MYKVHDVFISYRRKEADGSELGTTIARQIYKYLTSKGLEVFWDEERMENGPFPEQIEWQVRHAPNYIFIATDAAMRFRKVEPPNVDYVAEEVKLALKIYDENKEENRDDRILLPIKPHNFKRPSTTDPAYSEEIQKLLKFNSPNNLSGEILSKEDLEKIHRQVTTVNRGNLWNAGYHWYEQAKQKGNRFANLNIEKNIIPLAGEEKENEYHLPIRAHLEDKMDVPLMDMIRDTRKQHLYLIGEGGIGKTTALFSIMEHVYGPGNDEKDIERNRLDGQVPLFIELSKAPDTYGRLYEGGHSTFIQREVYRQIRQDLKVKQISSAAVEEIREVFNLDPNTAVKPIHDLFTHDAPAPEYLLLLDGLNEVSRTRIRHEKEIGGEKIVDVDAAVVTMILQEIKELMTECPNVRVILTSRSKEETNWSDKTILLYLSGVTDETIESYLRNQNLPDSRINTVMINQKLREILRIPLFLTVYASLKAENDVLTRGEILHSFFHQKKEELYSMKTRGEAVNEDVKNSAYAQQAMRLTPEMQSFILDFILPAIAWKMVKENVFYGKRDYIGQDGEGLSEIIEQVLTDNSSTAVCGRAGEEVFTDYRSRSDADKSTAETAENMIERLGFRMSKVISTVLNCAVMTLGILQTDGEEFGFIHHHIRDYFAAVYQINHLKLAVYWQGRKKNEIARECMTDWKDHPLLQEILNFIGESLKEVHNVPVCDELGNWHATVPEHSCDRNLISRAFDIYRGRFDGEDGYAVWNLLEILKCTRDDLSGLNLSDLNLTVCEVNGHTIGKRNLTARLDGSKITENFFMPHGHTSTVNSSTYSLDGKRIVTASADSTAKVWDTETMQEIGTLIGHRSSIKFAIYSPDRKHIVSASEDGTAKVWDANSFLEIGTLTGNSGSVNFAAYSPDGKKIITAYYNNIAKIWDSESLQEIGVLIGHSSRINSAVYSPDGRRILTASDDKTAKVWDADTFTEIFTLKKHNSHVNSAVFSPDGNSILTASGDNTAIIWDANSFLEKGTLKGYGIIIRHATYSPDGKRIITTSWDKSSIVMQKETGLELLSLDEHNFIGDGVVYSPDGKQIVKASDDNMAKIWDSETFLVIGSLENHTGIIKSAAYSPDGNWIITTFQSTAWNNMTKIWDAETLCEIKTLEGFRSEINSADYSPNGERIVTGSFEGVKVWDAITFRKIRSLNNYMEDDLAATYSPNGREIVTIPIYSGTTKIWDAETFHNIGLVGRFMTFSSNGQYILTASNDNTVKVWDSETLHEIGILRGHTDFVHSVVFSPNGQRILTTSKDHTVRIWDAETYQMMGLLKDQMKNVEYAVFSPDGSRIVTASWDAVKVWDVDTLQEVGTLKGYKDHIKLVTYSPNGKQIATVSNIAKIWDADTLQEIGTLTLAGDKSIVNFVTFTPDGKQIITSSYDCIIKVWDVETLQETWSIEKNRMVEFSPDGKRIITISCGTAKIWNANNFKCIHTIFEISGLNVVGVDFRHLHPDSRLSDEVKERLYEYGAIVDDR